MNSRKTIMCVQEPHKTRGGSPQSASWGLYVILNSEEGVRDLEFQKEANSQEDKNKCLPCHERPWNAERTLNTQAWSGCPGSSSPAHTFCSYLWWPALYLNLFRQLSVFHLAVSFWDSPIAAGIGVIWRHEEAGHLTVVHWQVDCIPGALLRLSLHLIFLCGLGFLRGWKS